MPLYEYRCRDCAALFEVLQSMGEGSDGLSCPRCGGDAVERQLSTFAGMTASASAAAGGSTSACGSPFT